ncbi:hypothetical protein [Fluviicola sp.]|uniref:hypothetical protein n=1 Tax=Fluviicola sp. TaxID=1917219 RepID=UPI0031D32605
MIRIPVILLTSWMYICLTAGCGERHYKVDKDKLLKQSLLVKIKDIKPEVKITLNREKITELGISPGFIGDQLQMAGANHLLGSVKAAQKLVIEDQNGKKYRLLEFAKIGIGITVTYEEPWGSNPFNF